MMSILLIGVTGGLVYTLAEITAGRSLARLVLMVTVLAVIQVIAESVGPWLTKVGEFMTKVSDFLSLFSGGI